MSHLDLSFTVWGKNDISPEALCTEVKVRDEGKK